MSQLWLFGVLLTVLRIVEPSHFRGGTISWKPKTIGTVQVCHRFAWTISAYPCDNNTIASGTIIAADQGNLTCLSGCSGSIGNVGIACTDFSVADGWTAGGRCYDYTIDPQTTSAFEASFASGDWITLVVGGNAIWNLKIKGNFSPRGDKGTVNSSPITTIAPVIKLLRTCNSVITIPVQDSDNDVVRCRWAGTDECESICDGFPNATLDANKCTLTYNGSSQAGWYGVALQIEDFATSQSNIALSSIPLQFLIQLFDSELSCGSGPTLVSPTPAAGSCLVIQPGNTLNLTVFANASSPSISIVDFTTSINVPIEVTKSAVTSVGSQTYSVTLTWTPTVLQYGSAIICYNAVDSNGLSSQAECVNINAGDVSGACDIDECIPNDGRGPCPQVCINTPGSFYCTCYPCVNGLCINSSCLCVATYTGSNCSQPVHSDSELNPCVNGGTRVTTGGNVTCICQPNTYGSYCENTVGTCTLSTAAAASLSSTIVRRRHLGTSQYQPATSCAEIKSVRSEATSGVYWTRSANGTLQLDFCQYQ